jgi:hypothetical protein
MSRINRKQTGVCFAVGCGRSGTHFLTRIFKEDPAIASHHLDTIGESTGDSFLEYCEWNRLPVDHEGFFLNRKELIDRSAAAGRLYFEANPYLSLSIVHLRERFNAQIIALVRNPHDVVNSHYVKGWYEYNFVRGSSEKAPGYQYQAKRANHFFGRIVPNGNEFDRWLRLSRIGKIAWMWNAVNKKIIGQLSAVPEEHRRLIKVEHIDFDMYLQLHSFIGGKAAMTKSEFSKIKNNRPGKGPEKRHMSDWSSREKREFIKETEEMCSILSY